MADDPEFGPAMAALNDRQRLFVMAMLDRPGCSFSQAARAAGYADPGSRNATIRVRGHILAHSPGIQAAMREEAGKRLNAASLMAANALIGVLTDKHSLAKDKIKAAGMLLDRSGFGAAQTINVNKTVSDRTGKAITAKIVELAQGLGLDPTRLLGVNSEPVVDGEFEEVGDGAATEG